MQCGNSRTEAVKRALYREGLTLVTLLMDIFYELLSSKMCISSILKLR